MGIDWKKITAQLNSETIRFALKQIEVKYPESTKNGLFEGNRQENGYPTDQLSGYKHDAFVAAVRHCATWMIMHGALPATRKYFNKEHDAYFLKQCVERWLRRTLRYRGLKVHIPAMAWITAAWIFGLEESNHNYPYYKISKRVILKGSYHDSHA